MKPRSSANDLPIPLLACLAAAAAATAPRPAHAKGSPLHWQSAFPVRSSAAGDVYFSARYFQPASGWHDLAVWRHGNDFLHRKTDGRLDLYVVSGHKGATSYRYRLFDRGRHVVIDVDHANLYRIGLFFDWFGLAHVVDRPKQAYSLTRTAARADEPECGCSWVLLERRQGKTASSASRICWSAAWGIPLRIRDKTAAGAWHDSFVVKSVRPVVRGTVAWQIPPTPAGWTRFDANQEINPSQGD